MASKKEDNRDIFEKALEDDRRKSLEEDGLRINQTLLATGLGGAAGYGAASLLARAARLKLPSRRVAKTFAAVGAGTASGALVKKKLWDQQSVERDKRRKKLLDFAPNDGSRRKE